MKEYIDQDNYDPDQICGDDDYLTGDTENISSQNIENREEIWRQHIFEKMMLAFNAIKTYTYENHLNILNAKKSRINILNLYY